jgi:hypothetical protein
MDTTNRLGLPYLAAAQSQKHVTHNEALRALDALVQIGVLAADITAPPATPAEGDRYIVGAAPTGAFAGKGQMLAAYDDGSWRFATPRTGWIAYVAGSGVLMLFDGSAWRDVATLLRRLGNITGLGIGTQPDAANPFSASLNTALFAARSPADGGTGDIRLTLNRSASARTGSLLFQSAWSGRAELGLMGDDLFRIRSSADGAAWRDVLTADPATGAVRFPNGVAESGGQALAGLRNLVVNGDFQVAQRGEGPFALTTAGAYGIDQWRAALSGAGTGSVARAAFAPGQADVPGGRFYLSLSATPGTGSVPDVQARLEDVGRPAGRTVTVSFAYRATAPVAVDAIQAFGTGGSPVNSLPVASLAASAAWMRRTATFAVPGIAGRTVGAGSYTALRFTLPAGSSATVDLADVQLEEGAVATSFERRLSAIELLLARRYLRRAATVQQPADLASEMRAVPVQSGTAPALFYSAEL